MELLKFEKHSNQLKLNTQSLVAQFIVGEISISK